MQIVLDGFALTAGPIMRAPGPARRLCLTGRVLYDWGLRIRTSVRMKGLVV
jgi:hypothetical protein